ncbi:DUF6017 domain-containing protein [Clostridium sp.]|uniref:DUF6017 domain-containing protein n=1 Tax=Clostridium sp. TaxID=1506 RepID=UPI002904C92D|nr:DUF6017 domain-containing protein [Clostridium sp.]MDU2155265.1 DUF6017 domain-containing protein [Clostridium sp.]
MAKIKKAYKQGFTTVSNDMYRDRRMAIAERGLLGTMLSLPDTWNFSIKGLASILPNGESSVKSSLRKLEELGYLKRERICDNKGKVVEWEYTFSDTPMFLEEGEKLRLERERKKAEKSLAEPTTPPEVENRHVDNPDIENPQVENQQVELPQVENHLDNINTNESNTKQSNNEESIHPSISPLEKIKQRSQTLHEDGMMDKKTYEELLYHYHQQLEYDILIQQNQFDQDKIDEFIEVMIDVELSDKALVQIGDTKYPKELVISRYRKLTYEHIEYILLCLKETTTQIRNMNGYLITTLFNAPKSISNYYAQKVNHDFSTGK